MKIISIIVAFIGLFFSFTNFIPISATPVILIFFIPFFIFQTINNKHHRGNNR